jgi:hypothetical protein
MLDFGTTCIIVPTFAEILQNNCCNNRILPIALSQELCALLHEDAVDAIPLEIALEGVEIRRTSGEYLVKIQVDPFHRDCLLEGLDDMGMPPHKLEHIEKFERHSSRMGRRRIAAGGAVGVPQHVIAWYSNAVQEVHRGCPMRRHVNGNVQVSFTESNTYTFCCMSLCSHAQACLSTQACTNLSDAISYHPAFCGCPYVILRCVFCTRACGRILDSILKLLYIQYNVCRLQVS